MSPVGIPQGSLGGYEEILPELRKRKGEQMKHLFKLASFCWILSPLVFWIMHHQGLINVEHQNATIQIFLAFASTICICLNIEN